MSMLLSQFGFLVCFFLCVCVCVCVFWLATAILFYFILFYFASLRGLQNLSSLISETTKS